MGSRSRRRGRQGGQSPGAPASTTDYTDEEGNVLTLRDELSAGTLRKLADLDAKPAASAEDRWQRRSEFLFERLAVRWEIAGLPLEDQKELLGRELGGAQPRARRPGRAPGQAPPRRRRLRTRPLRRCSSR
jgi:hypothetical protein